MKRFPVCLCLTILVLLLSSFQYACAQDMSDDPVIKDVQTVYQAVINGMDPFSLLKIEYRYMMDSLGGMDMPHHVQASESYLETIALGSRDTELVLKLRDRSAGAEPVYDLQPVFRNKENIEKLSDTGILNNALESLQPFQSPNSGRMYAILFLGELQFQLRYAHAQACFEKALGIFNEAAPRIETAMQSGNTDFDRELAAVLIVMSADLAQNTRAIAYYEKYKDKLEQLDDPEFLDKPYQALLHAYTVTGNQAMIAEIQAKLDALHGPPDMQYREQKMTEAIMEERIGKPDAFYEYEEPPTPVPPSEIITTLTITNISGVQADELTSALWVFDDLMDISTESFEGNTAVLKAVTLHTTAEEIAGFLKTAEFPGFLIRDVQLGPDAVSARALGIAQTQFNVLVPTFEYIAAPEESHGCQPLLAYIQTLRAAIPDQGAGDDFRDMLLAAGEAFAQSQNNNAAFFASGMHTPGTQLQAFPGLAVLVLGTYGLAAARTGQHAQALDYFARVHDFKEQMTADIMQPLIHRTYANEIAMGVQIATGPIPDFERASNALEQLKSKLDGDGEGIKLTLVQANLHYKSGDYDKALALFGEAGDEAARFVNLDSVAAYAMLGRGNCAIMLQRHDEAVAAFSDAASRAGGAGNKLLSGTALAHLARVQLFTGAYGPAQESATKALDIAQDLSISSLVWQARYTLARALEAQDMLAPALEQYQLAIGALDQTFNVPEDVGADAEDVFRYATALCARMDNPELAMQIVERGRAYGLKLEFQKSRVVFQPGERRQSAQKLDSFKKQITDFESQIQQESSSPAGEQSQDVVAALKKSLQDTQREYIKYVTELEHTHPELAALYKIEPVDLVKIRKELPDDMAVISYVIGDNALYIFYVRADRLGYHEVPVDGDTLTTQIKLMRSIISNPRNASAGDAERMDNFRRGAGRLYDILFKPVAPDLDGIARVALLPNGILNFVPFQALVPTDGSADYLVQKYAIFYLDSLAAVGNAVPAAADHNTHLYAFGNADQTLPAAEQEVNALQKLFPASSVFLRLKATETQAKTLSEQSGIFHFATHGVLDFKDISQSYITLAPDAGEDGKFTIEEVWGYWWGDSVLVSLSACSTALGELTVRGKSVNPAGAFLNAGAPSVLASLWNVDDAATSELMRDFYDNLTTMKKADALRAAQLALLSNPDTAHPYYWAPFMLIGDWR